MYTYRWNQWLMIFFCHCFFGWIFESTYVSLKSRHFVDRGFLRLPMLPLYGTGAVMMLFVSLPVKDHLVAVYFAGVVAATALEYVTGWGMEKLFKMRYWDYSDKRFQVKGYICLSSSIAWGFLSVLLTEVLHQPVERLVLGMDETLEQLLVTVVGVVFVADTVASTRAALELGQALEAVTRMKGELEELQVQLALLRSELRSQAERQLAAAHEEAVLRLASLKDEASLRMNGLKDDRVVRMAEETVRYASELKAEAHRRLEEARADVRERLEAAHEEFTEHVEELQERTAARLEGWKERVDERREELREQAGERFEDLLGSVAGGLREQQREGGNGEPGKPHIYDDGGLDGMSGQAAEQRQALTEQRQALTEQRQALADRIAVLADRIGAAADQAEALRARDRSRRDSLSGLRRFYRRGLLKGNPTAVSIQHPDALQELKEELKGLKGLKGSKGSRQETGHGEKTDR